ncbi:hypothetical protein DXG01_009382 [Tephrocybe rancida]|nr:hypothetical protein DXG01_009382 [Tephrocybe rancida]
MHQEHNIPWNALVSNFKFVRDNPHHTPHTTGIFFKQLPSQATTLNHFKRAFHNTITTFSATERQKYPTSFPAPISELLFSDDLRDRFPQVLNARNQRIEYWVQSTENNSGLPWWERRSSWVMKQVVKVLVSENEMEPLLILAQHPQAPLSHLNDRGHRLGFAIQGAMLAYMKLNIWVAMKLLEGREYLEMQDYPDMLYNATRDTDWAGPVVWHRAYFDALPMDEKTGLPMVHRDFVGLKRYLKTTFQLLYLHDMLAKECGVDPEWEIEIESCFPWR